MALRALRRRRPAGVLVALALALTLPAIASADVRDEQALAERYAPVVMLVEQPEECGPGEPYEPMDVNLLFGEPTVALRGPWNSTDLVKIGPSAGDLAGLYEYHLDFPGSPLEPGCGYEQWARRISKGSEPIVYAHVATDPGFPGKLALQYWFFYAFNDFNNTHEGDWEMIQLVFDAGDAAAALQEDHPAEVGYSSHEGAERASWGDDKLQIVDGTHPVVFPAAGSHANKFTEALYIGSSADAGVGCDDTQGPHVELRPAVRTIPSDPQAASDAFPWITFEGRWGELQKAFFNGPTGPNLKDQWTAPIEWAEGWRDRSYGVPTAGLLGTGATDLFCSGVEQGSAALTRLIRNPGPTLLFLIGLLGLAAWGIARATWTPVAPLRVARRRTWGQILSASARMYVARPRLFVGLGLLLIPIVFLITALQWLLIRGIDAIGSVTGEAAGFFAFFAVVIGTTLTLLGLGLVQAATACALDRDRRGPTDRADTGLPPRAPSDPAPARRDRDLRRRVGRAHDQRRPDPGGDLARRPLVPARSRRRAREPLGPRCARTQQGAGPRPLDQGGLARRPRRPGRAGCRPAARRAAHLRLELVARAPQSRLRARLRDRAAVRRARDGLRVLRRAHEARARAGRHPRRAAGRDHGRPRLIGPVGPALFPQAHPVPVELCGKRPGVGRTLRRVSAPTCG